jgi:RNA polymerase sigma-70 factor (ECF subfamily)
MCDYRGAGPLGAWLRVVAIRVARDLQRSQKAHLSLEDRGPAELRSKLPDPELEYLKRRYGQEFREAFASTLRSLPPRERNVLHLYFVEGMTSAAIGTLYRVQGATIRFWIKRSKAAILAGVRERLRSRLGAETEELESLLRLVKSELNVSISRFLRPR